VEAAGRAFVGGGNDLYKHAMTTWREQIAGAFGFGTAPFAMHQSDADLAKAAIRAAKAEGATREDFAREIALYARKYVSSEGILRERLRQDSATLDKLWKISG
jgi:hypothetical protein